MPKMVYGESTTLLEVPAGRYVARFLGTEAREPIRDSKFGHSDAPRMGWLWEVVEGPSRAKKISQESGVRAGPRTTAMRMLAGLSGGTLQLGAQPNTDDWIGKLYVVKVAVNPDSDKGNLHVADVEPYEASPSVRDQVAAALPPVPAGNGRPAAGPPPRRQASAPAAPPEPSFWVAKSDAGDPVRMTLRELQEWVAAEHKDPAEVEVAKDGEDEWKSAADFGVTSDIPW